MTHFEIMAENLAFPEGPVACDDGSVIVVECRTRSITRIRADGGRHVIARIDGAPNGLAVGPDGALYCCNNGGFAWHPYTGPETNFPTGTPADYRSGSIDRINVSTGKVERLYDRCDGVPLAGPNDIVFDSEGGFWFTDLGKDLGEHERHGGLYYAKADGSSIRCIVHGLGLNGVGLSPDGTKVYAAASFTRWLLEFDAGSKEKIAGHALQAGRIVADFPRRRFLDSLGMEADGTIAVAGLFDEPGIYRVDPATGAQRAVPFPDVMPTNIAFGGADMRTAYVTLTTTNRLVRLRWDAPGLRLPFNL